MMDCNYFICRIYLSMMFGNRDWVYLFVNVNMDMDMNIYLCLCM